MRMPASKLKVFRVLTSQFIADVVELVSFAVTPKARVIVLRYDIFFLVICVNVKEKFFNFRIIS